MDFNNAFRVHQNFVEQLPFVLGFLLLGGLVHPWYAMWVGYIHCVGRIVYTIGYTNWGPNMRLPGAVLGVLPLYVLGLATTYTCVREVLM